MNSITLVGRAGRDPEVRYFETGTMVANLSLAVNRRSKDEEPDWFNLEIWGKQAQVAADYVKKGSLIGVIGRVGQQKWTDRNTAEERTKTVVTVERLELLGPKPNRDDTPSEASPPPAPAAAAAATTRPATLYAPPVRTAVPQDEIPF